jgi:hypothetical protein
LAWQFLPYASLLTDTHNYSDVGIYDRVVIQEILKEIAQTQQVDLKAKQRFKGWSPQYYIDAWNLNDVSFLQSCCSERSRLTDAGCTSRTPSNNGKIHVEYAYHPLCEQHKQTYCSYQIALPSHSRCGADCGRGMYICFPHFTKLTQ